MTQVEDRISWLKNKGEDLDKINKEHKIINMWKKDREIIGTMKKPNLQIRRLHEGP